ncbi:MAG: HEPN domain-containing protein [Bacteroidales bacterium]|nr:HEPN domain-containing protein [Bacteroidales bacterium]
MNIENQDDYIKYRFRRAEESFDDALILIENKKWNTSINRLYYSCFYAVIALLLKNDIETHTHDGARIKFSNESIVLPLVDQVKEFLIEIKKFIAEGELGEAK